MMKFLLQTIGEKYCPIKVRSFQKK